MNPFRLSVGRFFIVLTLFLFSSLHLFAQTPDRIPHDAPVKNKAPLLESPFYPLPLTSVRPRGWLKHQLQVQADGLTGHLDEFWPDLGRESAWLGGKGEGWERGPYYLDGLVPLAYLLDDPALKKKAAAWVEWTLEHQRPDGAIGPEKNQDWWPNMIMLKVLTQHYEATGDERVIPLMTNYFKYHLKHFREKPLLDWASFRWGEELLSLIWLYNRTEDPELLELARGLHQQGYDWVKRYDVFRFTMKTNPEMLGFTSENRLPVEGMSAHGVNNAMALKYRALWALVSKDPVDRMLAAKQLNVLDAYHLQPNGMFSADEHLAGPGPNQGTELCAVVESMFSLEHMVSVLGDPGLSDRLERVTYNALPATFSADMWAHQYDQQVNQVMVDVHPREWTTNGPESNVFGLEPNFGCCTANMHQGWPKFASSLWMATSDDGLAAIAYAPSEVNTVIRGIPVNLVEETDYPFKDGVRLSVTTDKDIHFPLRLYVPGWSEVTSIQVNGDPAQEVKGGQYHTLERTWKTGDIVDIRFHMGLRVSRWIGQSAVIERGPLVFSLKIGEEWSKITEGMGRPAITPAADWQVKPTTPWNFGLILKIDRVAESISVVEKPVGIYPFSPDGAPVELRVKGRLIPEWQLEKGSAGAPPASPVVSKEPVTDLVLIPYGSAKLRLTTFPLIDTTTGE